MNLVKDAVTGVLSQMPTTSQFYPVIAKHSATAPFILQNRFFTRSCRVIKYFTKADIL
jgi:hypothetical protein